MKQSRTFEQAVYHLLNERAYPVGDCLYSHRRSDRLYGDVHWDGRNGRMLAHRAVYTVIHGEIPSGMVIRHTCDNAPCVNPDHLVVGTTAQNVRDIYERGHRTTDWRRGDEHPHAILTAKLVADLRRRAAAGESLWSLTASVENAAYLTIVNAVRGNTWQHVTQPPVAGRSRKPNSRALRVARRDDCLRAAELAELGMTLAEIGAALGVSRHTAYKLTRSGREIANAS